MESILECETVEMKKSKIVSMVVEAEGNEIRFVLRILKGALRIGFTGSLLHLSIGRALVNAKKVKVEKTLDEQLKLFSKKKNVEKMSEDNDDEYDDDSFIDDDMDEFDTDNNVNEEENDMIEENVNGNENDSVNKNVTGSDDKK